MSYSPSGLGSRSAAASTPRARRRSLSALPHGARVLACAAALVVAAAARVAGAQAAPALPVAAAAPLTLQAVYDAVDRANPRARAAAQLARAAAMRVSGTMRPPDPELQLGLMNYSLPSLKPDETLGMRQIQLMQMVPLPGKLSAAGAASQARADAAEARAADVRWDVRAQAAMAFYDAWAAGERIAIARETRRLVEDVAAVATSMYRVGDGRQTDVLRARVEIARMEEEIVRMEAMTDAARARMAASADMPTEALVGAPVIDGFPDSVPSRAELERLADAGRPMLAAGAADVRAASADARLVRRELWPDLQVGAQYSVRDLDGATDRMGSLMLGASLPIFARSRQLRMREETAAMHSMAEADLLAMRAETRARIAEAHAQLTSARRLAALYRTTVVPQAEAATSAALSAYRTGNVDFMTVSDNRMTVNRYREELVVLTATEGRAWAELEMLLGRPLVSTIPMRLTLGGTR